MRHSRQGLTGYCKVEMAIAKRLLQAALNLPLTIPHNRRSRIKTIDRSRQVENRFMDNSGPRERGIGFSRVEERKTGMMSGGICTKRYGWVARPTCETVHFRTHVPGRRSGHGLFYINSNALLGLPYRSMHFYLTRSWPRRHRCRRAGTGVVDGAQSSAMTLGRLARIAGGGGGHAEWLILGTEFNVPLGDCFFLIGVGSKVWRSQKLYWV